MGSRGPRSARAQRDAGQAQHAAARAGSRSRTRPRRRPRRSRAASVPRLEAGQRRPAALQVLRVHVVGQEGALADHVRVGVEHLVDALEAQVRHPDEVEVGVAERDAEGARALDRREGHLGLAQGFVSFAEAVHGSGPLSPDIFRRGGPTIIARQGLPALASTYNRLMGIDLQRTPVDARDGLRRRRRSAWTCSRWRSPACSCSPASPRWSPRASSSSRWRSR